MRDDLDNTTGGVGTWPERWFQHLGHHYILFMMVVTRVSGSVGGFLCVYYVDLILHLPSPIREHFHLSAAVVVLIALSITTFWAMLETQTLRYVLRCLNSGDTVSPATARRAALEAFSFAARHHRSEAWLVPITTLVPVLIYLRIVDGISGTVMINITQAVFMSIAMALMSTYFMIDRMMQPVIQFLVRRQLPIDYTMLPVSRLRGRLNLCFGVIIVCTALMIAALARQRGTDIIAAPEQSAEIVRDLRAHSTYIMLVAVVLGLLYSTELARSVATRVNRLLRAMKRVESGSLNENVLTTGNDEIDALARQFNAMVHQLNRNDRTIRELNTTLESKVQQRTKELSESQRELEGSLQQLQEYDRLKTEFFANVSHELRTPLTMILSPVERLIDQHASQMPETARAMLQVVQMNSQRLLELINRLLEFSKIEAGQANLKLASVELNHLIEQLVKAATPLARQRDIDLTVELDHSLAPTGGDLEKLEIVITNLISNALKFTPSGGKVRILTIQKDDCQRVEVCDSGIGIDPKDHQRVFERFVQIDGSASREFAGTGLGLPLAREFVHLHNGEMGVESELDSGATFWFELPWIAPPDDDVRSSTVLRRQVQRFAELEYLPQYDQSTSLHSRGPEHATRVLVVDDTPEVRLLLGDLLCTDYRVLLAEDGQKGMEVALRESPELIISDVMMPNVDGYQFCERIKTDARTKQIPFIMLTAKAERSMKIEGLDHGADDYLVKPFDSAELQARVRNLLKLRTLHLELDVRNQELEAALTALREAQNQLVHSEKMSSLGQLVAGLAHEINNAINAVYNGIQPMRLRTNRLKEKVMLALEQMPPGTDAPLHAEIRTAFERISVLANVIEEGATRTARIVSDLKTFSHPGTEATADFDLHNCLDMCLNLLSNQIRNRIEVHRDYQGPDTIHGPRGQLSQVFMNIMNNAQQAVRGEGDLWIRTHQSDREVVIQIRDNGAGMPDAVQQRIFDPFFTTKEPGVGTGLGLSISYGIINNLGGRISCESQEGEGTEFTISLPIRGSSAAPLQEQLDDVPTISAEALR